MTKGQNHCLSLIMESIRPQWYYFPYTPKDIIKLLGITNSSNLYNRAPKIQLTLSARLSLYHIKPMNNKPEIKSSC